MLSRLPDTPQSREILRQMLNVHGNYRSWFAQLMFVMKLI